MKINRFFEETLGANLANPRWSWGAVDPVANRVYLRVWDDQTISREGSDWVQVYYDKPLRKSPGFPERMDHLKAIESGLEGYAVVCTAVDPTNKEVRKIATFNEDELLLLGEELVVGRDTYRKVLRRVPTESVARRQTSNSTLAPDLRRIINRKPPENTTKDAMVSARVGQGAFRVAVLSQWDYRCAVTGSSTLDAIRASHIKPWRDSSNEERLDPLNGLPLIANLDALFDAGLISFDASGMLLSSSTLSLDERELFGLSELRLRHGVPRETGAYLSYHREHLFIL